jgi:hypothetical protein
MAFAFKKDLDKKMLTVKKNIRKCFVLDVDSYPSQNYTQQKYELNL